MAVQTFTPTQLVGNGGATVAATQNVPLAADTHKFLNDGKTFLRFDKGANAATVTITTPGTVRGIAVDNPTHTIAASTEAQYVGPFSTDLYNDADNYVTFAVSEATGMTCEVVRMP